MSKKEYTYEAVYLNRGIPTTVGIPQEGDDLIFTRPLFEEDNESHSARTFVLSVYRTVLDRREMLTNTMVMEMVEW